MTRCWSELSRHQTKPLGVRFIELQAKKVLRITLGLTCFDKKRRKSSSYVWPSPLQGLDVLHFPDLTQGLGNTMSLAWTEYIYPFDAGLQNLGVFFMLVWGFEMLGSLRWANRITDYWREKCFAVTPVAKHQSGLYFFLSSSVSTHKTVLQRTGPTLLQANAFDEKLLKERSVFCLVPHKTWPYKYHVNTSRYLTIQESIGPTYLQPLSGPLLKSLGLPSQALWMKEKSNMQSKLETSAFEGFYSYGALVPYKINMNLAIGRESKQRNNLLESTVTNMLGYRQLFPYKNGEKIRTSLHFPFVSKKKGKRDQLHLEPGATRCTSSQGSPLSCKLDQRCRISSWRLETRLDGFWSRGCRLCTVVVDL